MYILLLSFQLKESSAVSVENLEKCIQCGRTLKLPVSHCFPVPNENTEDLGLIWDNSLPVSPQEYHCQVYCQSFKTEIKNMIFFLIWQHISCM